MSDRFSAMDVLAAIAAVLAAASLLAFPFAVAPSFAGMYAELGGPLPRPTELALAPWPAPTAGAAVLLLASLSLRRGLDPLRRRLCLAGAVLAGFAALVALGYLMYLPLLELVDAVAES